VFGFGHAGLALSTSVVATFSAIALLLFLRGKIGGVRGEELLVNALKIGVAAAAMGVVCWFVVRESHVIFAGASGGFSARVADVVFGIPLGAASFYAAASALRVEELADATASVLRRFRGTA
jgi:peptidoglycan biosynthesis protein MviN/MurJ (putative lipid II flippase)